MHFFHSVRLSHWRTTFGFTSHPCYASFCQNLWFCAKWVLLEGKIRLLDFTSGSLLLALLLKPNGFSRSAVRSPWRISQTNVCSMLRKIRYSTVTDFARFLGWSTSFPKYSAIWYAKSCNITIFKAGETISEISGIKTKSLKIAWCFSSI